MAVPTEYKSSRTVNRYSVSSGFNPRRSLSPNNQARAMDSSQTSPQQSNLYGLPKSYTNDNFSYIHSIGSSLSIDSTAF